jgi:hypothetical protein
MPAPDERIAKLAGDKPRRVKTLVIPLEHLVKQLTGQRPIPAVGNLPHGFQLGSCAIKTIASGWGGTSERVLRFTVHSPTFEEVLPGAPVPELTPVFGAGR